ncbi:MAG TPA: hypothetical protein PKM73_14265 [Verrucomicrobiota bacterium]|nr:hypothetical protein [Verrucomicrobiota bacterium]HNU51728.1 hypothetical protein [Verrucomicrobiota bacterium]
MQSKVGQCLIFRFLCPDARFLWTSWIALPFAAFLLARLESAYLTPHTPVNLLPGLPWLAGTAHTHGVFWLGLILGSFNACWVAAWLSFALLVRHYPSLHSPHASLAAAGPLAAALLGAIWAASLASRKGADEVMGFFLVLHLPVQAMAFGLLWLGLRRTQRIALPILILIAFAALSLAFQLRYTEIERAEPPEVSVNYGSTLLALALAVCLWRHFGRSADYFVPKPSPRPQEVPNP